MLEKDHNPKQDVVVAQDEKASGLLVTPDPEEHPTCAGDASPHPEQPGYPYEV